MTLSSKPSPAIPAPAHALGLRHNHDAMSDRSGARAGEASTRAPVRPRLHAFRLPPSRPSRQERCGMRMPLHGNRAATTSTLQSETPTPKLELQEGSADGRGCEL